MLAHLPKPVLVQSNALPEGDRKLLAKNVTANR
jgi:hypothetical protein